jgi:GntR family transcriptional regulator
MGSGTLPGTSGWGLGVTGVGDTKTRSLYLALRERIASGAAPVGSRLPSEPELAASFRVSRVTIRRALAALRAEGLIERRPGAGTRVKRGVAPAAIIADVGDLVASLFDMGRRTDVRLLSFAYVDAPEVAAAMRLTPGERLQRSVRIRHVDGKPFSYLTAHVPERIGQTYSETDLATRPLLELLERSGFTVDHADQTVRATLAGPAVAEALDVAVGQPLLEVERIVFDAAGAGVEHLHALYRPDRYALRMEMRRTGTADRRRWSPVSPGNSTSRRPVTPSFPR